MIFTSEYEHTIDAQQRVAIPAEVRGRLDPKVDGAAFYAVPGHNGAIWLWPEKRFEALANALEQSILPDEDFSEYEELLFTQARRLEIDKAGRIRLPERVMELGRLKQHVVILGVKDHLEIRDAAEWEGIRQAKLEQQGEIMRRGRQALSRRQEASRRTGNLPPL